MSTSRSPFGPNGSTVDASYFADVLNGLAQQLVILDEAGSILLTNSSAS